MGRTANILKLFALASLASLSVSCAENQEFLVVTHVPTWPVLASGDVSTGDCVIDPGNTTALLRGTLDLSHETAYDMPAVVQNNLLPVAPMNSPNGIDDSEIQLLDAQVTLTTPQDPDLMDGIAASNEALTNFTVTLQSVSVDAGGTQGVLIKTIPATTARELRSAVVANYPAGTKIEVKAEVIIRGKRAASGGSRNEIEARPFIFPIDICEGCLTTCSPCAGGLCPAMVDDWTGGVCGNAQDFPVFPLSCSGE